MSSERLKLSPSAPVALWGYSGGGLATAWAAETALVVAALSRLYPDLAG